MTKSKLNKIKVPALVELAKKNGINLAENITKKEAVAALFAHFAKVDADSDVNKKADADNNSENNDNAKVDNEDPQAPRKTYAKEYKAKKGKMIKVLAFRNMSLIDGNHLTPGEECEITENEFKHIQADKRGLKFCELVK